MRAVIAAVCVTLAPLAAAEPQRIVSVGGAVTEIVYALGAGERLVGVDSTSTFPESTRKLPQVGYMRALSAEGVLALRPDVVLLAPEAGPPAAIRQLQAAGARVAPIPSAHSVEALRKRVRAVAAALQRETEGAALEARIAAEWDETAKRLQGLAGAPRVLFLLAHAGNNALVAGRETAADAMIALAGARNAVSAFSGYKPLTAEAAIDAAPEVILLTTEGLQVIGGPDKVWSRPGLALTPAARAKRVVDLDALYLLGFGPRTPLAVRDLAARLHDR